MSILRYSYEGLRTLVSELTDRVQNLNLRMACVYHTDRPPQLQTEALTTPLRCAPAVLRELGPGVDWWSHYVHPYSDSGLPAPGDGPSVVRLIHRGNAHEGRRPTDCEQCGREVAAELRRLNVGTVGEFIIYIYIIMMMTWRSPLYELCRFFCQFM